MNRIPGSVLLVASSVLPSLLTVSFANAAAKPAPTPGSCGTPATPSVTIPVPARKVIVQPIATKVFQLPNGSGIDFSADLQSILNTSVISTSAFSPVDPGGSGVVDPCQSHIEIRSAVTNFQLNVADIGVTFGYSPSGPIPIGAGTSITAKANVQIGVISMDFSVWSCSSGVCSAVAAVTADQTLAGGNLNMEIDFGMIRTAPTLIFNTPLGSVFRTIMINGMSQLSASSRMNELPWQAMVKEVTPSAGTLIFDAGTQSRILSNQAFEVYAPADTTSSGVCHVFETVAYIHTVEADTVSSIAVIDQTMGNRGVQVGDVVMIRTTGLK